MAFKICKILLLTYILMALLCHVTSRHFVNIEFPSHLVDILKYQPEKFVIIYIQFEDDFNHIPIRNIRHLHFTNLSQQCINHLESSQTEIQTLHFTRPSVLIAAQNEYKLTKSLNCFYIFFEFISNYPSFIWRAFRKNSGQ